MEKVTTTMKLKEKVVVVTGGSSGIGHQIVRDLIKEGAIVSILSRNKDIMDAVISKEPQNKVYGFECDITNITQVENAFNKIKNRLGNIYGLVNNAGINPSRNNILNTSINDWTKTLNVNLTGSFNCSKAAVPQMLKNRAGSIVNISSIAGITAIENRTAYMASKWGLLGLSSSLAIDFSGKNIRVNSICPGYVKTPLTSKYLDRLSKQRKESLIKSHLLGRLGKPEDISKAVIFLLSEDASWVTGAIIPVDGGYSLGKIN